MQQKLVRKFWFFSIHNEINNRVKYLTSGVTESDAAGWSLCSEEKP